MTSSASHSTTLTPVQQQMRRETRALAVSHAIYVALVLAEESGWAEAVDILGTLALVAQKRYRSELDRAEF